MKKVTLKQMLENIVECILANAEIPKYYYKNGEEEFHEITEIDLLQGRFKTEDNDFSEFEWELEESNVYIEEREYERD